MLYIINEFVFLRQTRIEKRHSLWDLRKPFFELGCYIFFSLNCHGVSPFISGRGRKAGVRAFVHETFIEIFLHKFH